MVCFWLITILVLEILTGISCKTKEDCKCSPRKPARVFLPQLEGPWYVVAMINETNLSEHKECIKMTYTYDYAKEIVSVTRSSIPYNSTQVVENTAAFGMITPGIIDATYLVDGVEVNYHDHYLEHTPGESFIFTTCQRNDQEIFTDRIALFMFNRDVSEEIIAEKFRKINVTIGGKNAYYRVRQNNCNN